MAAESGKDADEIGTVVSTHDGPSPSSIDFVVNSGAVHRGQFVEMEYSEGMLIALVTDVIKTNRYFERAESVKEFESNGARLFEQFPTAEWEYLVAKTRPLGVYNSGMIKRPTYPPSPGTKVCIAAKETLKDFLGLDEHSGINLGTVEYHDLPVMLNISRLLRKHLAILSISGSGKSHTVACLIEELLNRKKEHGRIAVVVIDPHGEYTSFAVQPDAQGYADFSSKTYLIRGRDMKIGVPRLSMGMFAAIIPQLSAAQKRDLGRALEKIGAEMRSGKGPFDLRNVRAELLNDKQTKENTKKTLLSWIASLEELELFSKTDTPSIESIVKPGCLTVVDLSELISMKKKQIIVSYLAHKLFFGRRAKKLPPFLLVLEEAHQFVPEGAGRGEAISRGIIGTIAREGRKFGASLCLVSQRPIQLDTTTLSQCNSQLILRITNPYDLEHIGKSAEGLDRRSLDMITSLRVGEALLIGEAVNHPVFCRVRKRTSQESKHEMPLEKAAQLFEQGREKAEAEAEEFL